MNSKAELIAAVLALVIHSVRKAAHQMDAEIAGFRLPERRCHDRWRSLGWIELPAVVFDARHQHSTDALQLD